MTTVSFSIAGNRGGASQCLVDVARCNFNGFAWGNSMVFFQTVGAILLATAFPVAMMWSSGGFVGQKPPPQWAVSLIRFAISACLFVICAVGAIIAYMEYRETFYALPLAAMICGVGVSAIIGVNTYSGG